ncbi:NADH-quinone oxidoreductase subunit L [Acidiphilium sp. AL]|uniref:NADH-quinone oxidoreductase subunit L n=1 Tax=Acidiphilium iwatense TaxID=768198 RepID=A0ABS9DWF2_9PROT|nr:MULTISPECIES: NADH-quinone oxidoreductase subunit L [Acidiphilium]MCF3947062.1 NADH-quinone oxidoreductase subunit L [Acidiphilium iwatense]MCU4160464.1 NADH-quinone oxidoreductase subunit L [Acidiphilium sp. AL]
MMLAIAVLAPLAGALLVGLLRPFVTRGMAVGLSVASLIISALAAIVTDYRHLVLQVPDHLVVLGPWISVAQFTPHWTLRVDTLSLVMVGMVSVVSAIIHVYSVGYMAGDRTEPRFFAYISLFTFAMLMLVTANNLLQLFFGWEGVGLMSYLLIGYWYDRASANEAAIKAFIVNRVGDLFFAVGIALTYLQFHSVDYSVIFNGATQAVSARYHVFGADLPVLEVISILLFVGAMGKSAQLFLHTWLPDAMEGPTPISALIHAATMVTAGVFMTVRMSPLIAQAPVAMDVIAVIGGATAFFAATIGCVQNDIKRIIAYSTCSQLGYMFLAVGVGAAPAAIFHLVNHAFFKALLFLAAGSVIHALAEEQDIRRMGGLWRKLPVTYVTMWAGALALAAIPPFSGFYSKDAILAAAFADHSASAMFGWLLGTLAAGLTAFYIVRLLLMVFHGTPRGPREAIAHAHESPLVMLGPLIVLAVGALASGFLLAPSFIGGRFGAFWSSSIALPAHGAVMQALHLVPVWAERMPLLLAIAGIGVAYWLYELAPGLPARLARALPGLYAFLLNKWYFDELYDAVFVRPAWRLARFIWRVGDEEVIDGIPDGIARLTSDASGQAVKLQSGSIAVYGFVMLIGLTVLITLFLLVR